MTIEQEAEEYRIQMFPKLNKEWDGLDLHYLDLCFADFAKKKILQAQIDVLDNLEFNPRDHIMNFIVFIKNKIKDLQKQLKELE